MNYLILPVFVLLVFPASNIKAAEKRMPMSSAISKLEKRIGNPFFGETGGDSCSVKISELSKSYLIVISSAFGGLTKAEIKKTTRVSFQSLSVNDGLNTEEIFGADDANGHRVYFSVYSRTSTLNLGAWNRTFTIWDDSPLPSYNRHMNSTQQCKYWE